MMFTCNSSLCDEVEAINAIYGDGTITVASSHDLHTSALLLLPGYPHRFQIRFPADYPDLPPQLIGSDSLLPSTDRKAQQYVSYMRALLLAVHTSGSVCLLDMIEESQSLIENTLDHATHARTSFKFLETSKDLAQRAYTKCIESNFESTDFLNSITTCAVCLERCFKVDAANLSCKHSFCIECLCEGLRMMLDEGDDFRCCGKHIPASTVRSLCILSPNEFAVYDKWLKELLNPVRLHCYDEQCNAVVSRSLAKGDAAKCPACKRWMCLGCGRWDHTGVCYNDRKMLALIKKENLRACPGCGFLTKKNGGCRHMTCRCRTLWCWDCGKQRHVNMARECECDR